MDYTFGSQVGGQHKSSLCLNAIIDPLLLVQQTAQQDEVWKSVTPNLGPFYSIEDDPLKHFVTSDQHYFWLLLLADINGADKLISEDDIEVQDKINQDKKSWTTRGEDDAIQKWQRNSRNWNPSIAWSDTHESQSTDAKVCFESLREVLRSLRVPPVVCTILLYSLGGWY
jgi:hypothetical protein